MNSYDILYGMEYVDTDLINKALNYGKKRRMYGVIKGLSVACLAFGIVITGINIQNALSVKNSDITKRFGVFPVNPAIENPFKASSLSAGAAIYQYYEYIYNITTKFKNFSVVYGTVKNIATVKTFVPITGSTFYITIFDLKIIKSYRGAQKSGSIRVAGVVFESNTINTHYMNSINLNITEGQNAVFALYDKNANLDQNAMKELAIDLFDYADYYVSIQYDTDENGAKIAWYDYMTFDEISELFENAPYDKDYLYNKYGA